VPCCGGEALPQAGAPLLELLRGADLVVEDRPVHVEAAHLRAAIRPGLLDPQDGEPGLRGEPRRERREMSQVGLAAVLIDEPDVQVPVVPRR
jgi:hypothetical protein